MGAFFRIVGTPDDRNPGQLPPVYLTQYYQYLGIQHEQVTQGYDTIPVLGRAGFIKLFVIYTKRDPNLAFQQLSEAITRFQLRDPMPPNNLWPLVPRQLLPYVADPSIVALFEDMRRRYSQEKQVQTLFRPLFH